jgi:uncharacterized protein (UPF0548 family)
MFSVRKPTSAKLATICESAQASPLSYSKYAGAISTLNGPTGLHAPPGFSIDHTRSEIGHGLSGFEAAKSALRQWQHFDLGWVRVANSEAPIAPGEVVAVEVHALGLWSLNLSRTLYVIDEPNRFGFAYGTTPLHAERGEERFLLEYDPNSGKLSYDLLAISQPAHPLAKLPYPYTRSLQRRFARDSHTKMAQLAAIQEQQDFGR